MRMIVMRTTAALMFGFVLSCGVTSSAIAQLPAGAKVQGIFSKDDQQRRAREAEQAVQRAQQEAIEEAQNHPRIEMWVPENAAGYAAPAGYAYAQPAAYGYAMPVQPASNNEAMDGGVQPAFHH